MTALHPPALYIGHDRAVTVVSAQPLKVENGGARTYRWGSVVEIVPGGSPDGLKPRPLLILSILLFVASAGIAALGSMWAWFPALAGAVLLVASGQLEGERRRPGAILAPNFDREAEQTCLLSEHRERNDFWAGLTLGKRVCQTLPELAGMVDTDAAERLLASALFDLAKVLQRRQEVRGLVTELDQHGRHGLPASNPAVRKLLAQRQRLTEALSSLDADVARRLAGLEATAVASENFLREREIHRMATRVDLTLASLAPTDLPGAPDSGLELADEVEAVLTVYRELNERYGAGI
ncbi:hypothetical protein [Phytohabitans houttuyneae]|uniref:Uncharacterized protein n=1 Tax=Phytohabitans houttuyneae TaxID=1076126 RepID=A0A6V8KFX7_9ACTN|nr:hypothetical protein [Phytohabitans houttuyneae]GFJ82714.1 hypothetical protein Phou_068940 [Phytohabitans houttuyneae]